MPLWLNRSLSPWLTFLFKLQTLFHCWMLYNALLFFSIIAWSLLNFSFCYLYTSWFVKILHVIYTAEGTVHFPSLWMNWLRTLTSTFMPSVSCWNFLFIMPAIFTRCVFWCYVPFWSTLCVCIMHPVNCSFLNTVVARGLPPPPRGSVYGQVMFEIVELN